MTVQIANNEQVELLKPYFAENVHYHWQQSVALFQSIPGLVGFWPFSSVQRSTGNVYDLSGQGRTLTYTGAVTSTFNIYNNIVPYLDFDGATNYLNRADETDLDVLGTETINAAAIRGLTLGGWFWFDSVAGTRPLITKDDASSNRSYSLGYASGAQIYVFGAAGTNSLATGGALSAGAWNFICGRWTPSTEVAIFSNGTKVTNTVSIIAATNNTTTPLKIGTDNTVRFFDGRGTLCFLGHQILPDDFIALLYNTSKGAFGL